MNPEKSIALTFSLMNSENKWSSISSSAFNPSRVEHIFIVRRLPVDLLRSIYVFPVSAGFSGFLIWIKTLIPEDYCKCGDKGGTEKACEYAVLVSLQEPESELYNSGIVDVSHRYPKMYVVRPQFFVPLITLLRNAALNSLKYKSELALVRSQNVDITKFETQLDEFKTAFGRNWRLASEGFEETVKRIDKAIKDLEKPRKRCTSPPTTCAWPTTRPTI